MTATWWIGPAWVGRTIARWMLALFLPHGVTCNCWYHRPVGRPAPASVPPMTSLPPVSVVGPAGPPPSSAAWGFGQWQWQPGGIIPQPGPMTRELWMETTKRREQ